MAKAMVYARKGTLLGVFTNKKNLWEDLCRENGGNCDNLIIRTTPTRTCGMSYAQMTKYLGMRKMLNVYENGNSEHYSSAEYKIWQMEMNQHFTLEGGIEKEETDEESEEPEPEEEETDEDGKPGQPVQATLDSDLP